LEQHLYGVKLDPNTNPVIAKLVKNLIAYTSFKSLSTNVKGMVSNFLQGEYQMMIEAGAGEFYNIKNFLKAHALLFGRAGVLGEIMNLFTNNRTSKAVLMRDYFDPLNEDFSDKAHKRYYKSWFRQLISKDCAFIGYSAGEYLIHYVNMYAILDNVKVLHNGRRISLYNVFELSKKQDGNRQLLLKQGVTTLDGHLIDKDFIDKVRKTIRYCNQTCHGAMNEEDKGLIHQDLMGRAVMNFRQWMVEHYSRRLRKMHWDGSIKKWRQGYWNTSWEWLRKDTEEAREEEKALKRWAKILGVFFKDFATFTVRASSHWNNLNTM